MKRIKLTRGKRALVDDEDFEFLSKWKWCTSGGYASKSVRLSNGSKSNIRMHRLIMLPRRGEEVDHVDRDRLDNRRSKLRVCTSSENKCNAPARISNTSGFKGVGWHIASLKWRAVIQVEGEHRHIGLFKSKEDAARAYNKAAAELHGEFAHQNVIGAGNE